MGQKVHPLGFRLGVSQKHISHWFIDNNHYSQLVVEDQFIRHFFYKKFPGIASINIQRDLNRIIIEILSANTRDFLMDGGKMTAKATLSSSSQVNTTGTPSGATSFSESHQIVQESGTPGLQKQGFCTPEGHSDQAKLSQNEELDFSNTSQTQKSGQQKVETNPVDKTSSFTKTGGVQKRSGAPGGALVTGGASVTNLCDQLLKELTIYRDTQLKKTFKLKWKNSKVIPSVSDRGKPDNLSAINKKDSDSLKNSESVSDSGQAKTLSVSTEFDSPTASPSKPPAGVLKKTTHEKSHAKAPLLQAEGGGPLVHEIELFWTRVENPNTSAACLAEFIVEQLEKRVPFRRVLKRSIQKAEEASVEGIKVQISGRLNGAEIARSERIHKGQVPLHTLRAKIEYNSRTAKTIYGLLGVKVWVFNGFADLNQTKLLT